MPIPDPLHQEPQVCHSPGPPPDSMLLPENSGGLHSPFQLSPHSESGSTFFGCKHLTGPGWGQKGPEAPCAAAVDGSVARKNSVPRVPDSGTNPSSVTVPVLPWTGSSLAHMALLGRCSLGKDTCLGKQDPG